MDKARKEFEDENIEFTEKKKAEEIKMRINGARPDTLITQ